MSDIEFEWDPKKEKANTKKHGVSFEDAKAAFYDETAMVFHDPDHLRDCAMNARTLEMKWVSGNDK